MTATHRALRPAIASDSGMFPGMATPRRPRGSLNDAVATGWKVERAAKDRFDQLARHANVSSAVFFERLVESIEVDSRGLPVWWTSETEPNEELPITTT